MSAIRLSMRPARVLRPLCPLRPLRPLRLLRPRCPPLLGRLLGAAALLSAVAAPFAADARATGISTETLAKSTTAWDQTGYTAYPPGVPEPTLVRITIAPNTRLDWHIHPMPAIGYVASGQLTVERADNGAQRSFVAGQTVTELVDVPHRGWTGDTGAELLVFYARSVQQLLAVISPNAGQLAQDETASLPRD
jgi:quercetin dioxygenase-like cupin family protein